MPYGGPEQFEGVEGQKPPTQLNPMAPPDVSLSMGPVQQLLDMLMGPPGANFQPQYTLPTQFAPGTQTLLRQSDLGPQGWQPAQPGSLPPPSQSPIPAR